MEKLRPLILYITMAMLLVSLISFPTILKVFFPLPTPKIATDAARSQSEISGVDETQSEGPSSALALMREKPLTKSESQKTQPSPQPLHNAQGHREEQADKESLRSTERRLAPTKLTELEQLQLEQQRLLEQQAAQEAADYAESLRSTSLVRPKR